MLSKKQIDKRAILKGMIDRAREQAEDFIELRAAEIKAEAPTIPLDVIKLQIKARAGVGHCLCRAALLELQGD